MVKFCTGIAVFGFWIVFQVSAFALTTTNIINMNMNININNSNASKRRRVMTTSATTSIAAASMSTISKSIPKDDGRDIGSTKCSSSSALQKIPNKPSLSSVKNDRNRHTHARHTAKTMVKRMHACGKDYNAALNIFYQAHPILMPKSDSASSSPSSSFESKPIINLFNILSKYGRSDIAFDILQRTIERHEEKGMGLDASINIIPTNYLITVYKAIMGIIPNMSPNSSSDNREKQKLILQYIYQDIPKYTKQAPPIDVYHMALSSLGKCRQMDTILTMIHDMECNKLRCVSMNISEGGNENENEKGTMLEYNLPSPDRMAFMCALTGSIKCKSFHHSMELMNLMKDRQRQDKGMVLDKVIYKQVLSSLASTKTNDRCEYAKHIWDQMESDGDQMTSDASYKTLISIFSKENEWDYVKAVKDKMEEREWEQRGKRNHDETKMMTSKRQQEEQSKKSFTPSYLKDLELLEKIPEKKPWYKLGTVSGIQNKNGAEIQIDFGLQTHRNPMLNGISLVFYDAPSSSSSGKGDKLGFILLRNKLVEAEVKKETSTDEDANADVDADADAGGSSSKKKLLYSAIMGMLVDDNQRGKGLANIFMAIWLQLCLDCDALPRSEMINKPLLSLVLSRYEFVPISDSKIELEISPLEHVREYNNMKINSDDGEGIQTLQILREKLGYEPQFGLYSKSVSLNIGHFGQRELRTQKMFVTRYPPNPRGKPTAVKTCFEHPMTLCAQREYMKKGGQHRKDESDHNDKGGDNHGNRDYMSARSQLVRSVEDTWKGGQFHLNVDVALLRRVLFGYLY